VTDHDNRRDFSRVELHSEAELACGDRIVSGRLVDVSMRGVGLDCDARLPLHATCRATIFLGDSKENPLCIKAKGEVVRSTEDGIGVEFTEIDLDSFEHLRNLVRMNADDVSQVEGEFKVHLGLKRPEGF